jgi:hypothetical protein
MGLMRLSLESIKEVQGGVALEMFQNALHRAVRDCIDRPGDKRVRKVTLQMNVTPVAVVNGNTIDCDGAKGVFQCRSKMPDYETAEIDFGVQNSGDLIFNPDSPRDHRQTTLLPSDESEA